jgi:hypothetical protein
MILAKPVVANQFWILKKDDRKIGQVEAVEDGYDVKILDRVARYKTIKMAGRAANIEFEKPEKTRQAPRNLVHGFEVTGRVYNPLWNVQLKLPLFTKDAKSKSWYAAGWYRVKQHRNWKVMQNPKLITLQRYQYQGPFHTEEQARDQSIS